MTWLLITLFGFMVLRPNKNSVCLFRFRNVVCAASRLTTLVVRNICSDAMLKLIGAHCNILQYLVVANSKQVSIRLGAGGEQQKGSLGSWRDGVLNEMA